MRHYLAMGVALFALAACSGGEKKAETAPAESPVAAATSAPSTVAAAPALADVDMVQAGKWSMTISSMGQTLPTTEVCVKKSMTYADAQEAQKQSGVECSENTYKREGDKLLGHSVCSVKGMAGAGPMKMTTDVVIVGDLKSAYTVDQTTTMDPAPAGMAAMKSSIVAKRTGECDPEK